jgi:hypothetical protein
MRNRTGARSRVAVLALAVSLLAVAGLVGAAAPGQAATSFSVNLQPLIGSAGNEIPQVTFGGKIGYHLLVTNTGDSTTQHASIVVTSTNATALDDDNANCAPNPDNAHQLVCTPPGGTLAPDGTFEVRFRFTAPASGTQVSTTASISIAAQSVGGKKNQGTTLASSDPVLTNLAENATKHDTFLRADEDAATGALTSTHKQNFGVQLPTTLLGDPFGVALSIHDLLGTICVGCLPVHTELAIPAASDVSLLGNPFYNGTTFNPYGWTMTARYDPSFQVDGITHVDDDEVSHDVPACSSLVGGAPTVAVPLCWDTFVPKKNAPQGQKEATATGRGLENGKIGFG